VLALAQSTDSDDAVLHALRRRDPGAQAFTLGDEAALPLYRRNPTTFAPFILAHVQRQWDGDDEDFAQLRAEARARGDEATYWALFRELAEPSEWAAELRQLLKHPVPPSEILGALRQRQPHDTDELDAGIFADFVERYGAAVIPYIEENLEWVAPRQAARLLPVIQRLGDEPVYWRIFFKAGNAHQWNEALRQLLAQPLADDDLVRALARRTPPLPAPGWQVTPATAQTLYARNPRLFRPFLERTMGEATLPLFQAAEDAGDEDFLDFLTYRFLRLMSTLVYNAYPTPAQLSWRKPDPRSQKHLEEIGGVLTARFDRLFAELPTKYVHHAANTLARFDAGEPGLTPRDVALNPAMAYLHSQHREDWCRSVHAIRELLESPHVRVQLLGLTLLGAGGAAAAERVRENLLPLRALLLGSDPRVVKRQALLCLEHAGRQSAALAGQLLPVLEDTLYFRGKHAIDESIMVSFVRLKTFWSAQPPATQPA
jgi:hypothetical protein